VVLIFREIIFSKNTIAHKGASSGHPPSPKQRCIFLIGKRHGQFLPLVGGLWKKGKTPWVILLGILSFPNTKKHIGKMLAKI